MLDELGESELMIRRLILEKIVREAQADGDERWQQVQEQQIEPINQALSRLRSGRTQEIACKYAASQAAGRIQP